MNLRLAEVPLDHPMLVEWFAKLESSPKYNPFGFDVYMPEYWLGLWAGDKLRAAYGFVLKPGNLLIVSAGVCEPSKAGFAALPTLAIMLKESLKKYRMIFVVSTANKRMLKITDSVLKAKTIAEVKELA